MWRQLPKVFCSVEVSAGHIPTSSIVFHPQWFLLFQAFTPCNNYMTYTPHLPHTQISTFRQRKGRSPDTITWQPNTHFVIISCQGRGARAGGGGSPACQWRWHVHDSIRPSRLRRARPKNTSQKDLENTWKMENVFPVLVLWEKFEETLNNSNEFHFVVFVPTTCSWHELSEFLRLKCVHAQAVVNRSHDVTFHHWTCPNLAWFLRTEAISSLGLSFSSSQWPVFFASFPETTMRNFYSPERSAAFNLIQCRNLRLSFRASVPNMVTVSAVFVQ